MWEWHRRLGHIGFDNLIKLLKVAEGLDITEKQIKARIGIICPVCATSKALNRVPRDPATRRSRIPGEVMHVDIWGPYPVPALYGMMYELAYTDDATRYTWTARLKNKLDIPKVFKRMHKRIEKKYNFTLRVYRLDTEFPKYSKLSRWFTKKGITLKPSVPYQHFMNGVAERGFRTKRGLASAMLRETNLSGQLLSILAVNPSDTLA